MAAAGRRIMSRRCGRAAWNSAGWIGQLNQGKTQGAFSYGTYDTYPFIMMSYDDTLSALSTLAHELGHSMHSYLTRQHQPLVY